MATNPAKSAVRTGAFGPFGQASNHQVMNGFPNYFMTFDAAASPILSPIASLSNSVAQKITVPGGAVSFTIRGVNAVRVSEDSAFGSYYTVPAGVSETFPCVSPDLDSATSNTGAFYIMSDSTAGIVSFRFHNV